MLVLYNRIKAKYEAFSEETVWASSKSDKKELDEMIDLKHVLDYVDMHIEDKITLADLASVAGYSPFHFSRIFSETMGLSATTYVRVRKFQYAIIDLDNGKSVIVTAIKYGFESHEGFTRSFKQLYGFAPEYLKNQHVSYSLPDIIIPIIRSSESMKTEETLNDDMHAMFYAIFQQSLSEKEQGFCETISIRLLADNIIEISDDGRGIPLSEDLNICKERINSLFANSPITELAYNAIDDFSSIELNMICSLAEKFSVTVYKEGIQYTQDYVRGIPTHELFVKPSTKLHGMRVSMKPDTRIFGNTKWDKAKIEKLCGINL